MPEINTSIFDLFKIGPGPSSSHTIGPMQAALEFRDLLSHLAPAQIERADHLEVELFGSLSATGLGHGTDRAILAGLLGWEPEFVNPRELDSLASLSRDGLTTRIGNKTFNLDNNTICFGPVSHDHAYSNTMDFHLTGPEGVVFSRRGYSIGGGLIKWDGAPEPNTGRPLYPYSTMKELLAVLEDDRLSLPGLIIANEKAITGRTEQDIDEKLEKVLAVMDHSVEQGLQTGGVLPGTIGLSRKAQTLNAHAEDIQDEAEKTLVKLNVWAMAVGEENAAGHIVVTAPTLGSSGVLPSLIRLLTKKDHLDVSRIKEGLLVAAAVGFIIKNNASIAGADVGCQGEIGSATAMGAALLAQGRGFTPQVAACAAEIAMEHHLGLTCDPVGGYVQIPCIERNAMGVVKAYNAFLLASRGDPSRQKVDFDRVVEVMSVTGRDMSAKYKETSQGGLASSMTAC
jgi:L-serine dehydratase